MADPCSGLYSAAENQSNAPPRAVTLGATLHCEEKHGFGFTAQHGGLYHRLANGHLSYPTRRFIQRSR